MIARGHSPRFLIFSGQRTEGAGRHLARLKSAFTSNETGLLLCVEGKSVCPEPSRKKDKTES